MYDDNEQAAIVRAEAHEPLRTPFKPGDRVTVASSKFPGVWTVDRLMKVNLKVTQGTRRLNVAPGYLTKVTGDAGDLEPDLGVPFHDILAPGEVVTVDRKPGYWVVLKDNGDRVNVALVGGDGGRYWRVPRPAVTVVKVTVTVVE